MGKRWKNVTGVIGSGHSWRVLSRSSNSSHFREQGDATVSRGRQGEPDGHRGMPPRKPGRNEPYGRTMFLTLLLCTLFLTMMSRPFLARSAPDRVNFQEMEPGDRDRDGDSFGVLPDQSQASDFEPGDAEDGGDFGNVDAFDDEIEPADLDRGGDFGGPSSPPKKKLNNNTIQ